jgi:hypothetical protein
MTARQRSRRQSRRRNHTEKSPTSRRLIAAGGLTAGATLAMAGAAHAATQSTVGTLADDGSLATDCTNAANVDCTLRRAVDLANLDAAADKVVFRSGLSGTTNLNPGGQIEITEPLNIHGPGASRVTLYGEDTTRLFYVNPDTDGDPVTISGLRLIHGYYSGGGGGGAISSNYADLTIANAVISDNKAGGGARGGGIYSYHGSLTINSSTVTGNYSTQNGGGIGSRYADLLVKDSTVSGSYADGYGGGIWTDAGDLTVSRSTLTENDAAARGGGIYSNSDGVADLVTVARSTVTGNHALGSDGGGVRVCCSTDGTLKVVGSTITGNTAATFGGGVNSYVVDPVLQDSIVSGNVATPAASSDVDEALVSTYFQTAFSLVGIPGGYVESTVPASNLFGVAPQLGPLANNGGPTKTELPATTSPVVNKGKSFGLTTDQRGLTRPVAFPGVANSAAAGADGADIGAVELQFTPPPPPPGGSTTPPTTHKKKCKKKKHKRSAQSAKKKKCKKKKKK